MVQEMKIIKNAKTVSDIEDIEKIKSLANNKYYNKTPLLLKPYMRCILLRPTGFVLSIAILQQFFSIIPFLFLWYIFNKFDISLASLPENFVVKGTELMHNGLTNWDDSQGDKLRAELSGANAFALIKLLSPVIWISAILFAPFFDKFVLRSITRIIKKPFQRFRKGNQVPKNDVSKQNDNIPPEVRN